MRIPRPGPRKPHRVGVQKSGRKKQNARISAGVLGQMAEWTGLEPATSGVTGQHSNRLNYHSALRRKIIQAGIALRNTRTEFFDWWVLRVSNPRPSPCKGDAVPLS